MGAGGCGRGDPSPTPQRALLRAGFARCGGGTRAPGGAPLPGCGASGVGRSSDPDCPPSGRAAGAHYPLAVGAGDAGVRTRPQPHSARSCELALRAVGAARGCPGGAPPAWMWGVRGRALSHPRLPALWAGCWGPVPTGCGCGGVRAWGPVTNPTARALCELALNPHGTGSCVLWGRPEGAPRGAPLALVRGVWDWALSHPRKPALWAGCRGPLPTGCGCGGGAGVGTRQQPHSARSCELSLRAVGLARGRPGGGASCLDVGRPGSGALPPPAARPLGRLPGPTTHWLCLRGDAGVGTRQQPHRARSCELALCAVGAARGCPGGAPPAWVWGVRGRALSHPRLPTLWAGCGGPLPTGCGCGGGVRAWGPVTNPTARALASWLCALWGRHEGAGGGAPCLVVARPGSGALPTPTARPLGGLPGPTTHWLWVRGGAGVGTRPKPHSARSCELALRAVGAARGCPGGAPPAWVWGVRGQALSQPRLPTL